MTCKSEEPPSEIKLTTAQWDPVTIPANGVQISDHTLTAPPGVAEPSTLAPVTLPTTAAPPVSPGVAPPLTPGMDVAMLWATFQQWCAAQKLQAPSGVGQAPLGILDPNMLGLLTQGIPAPTAGQPGVTLSGVQSDPSVTSVTTHLPDDGQPVTSWQGQTLAPVNADGITMVTTAAETITSNSLLLSVDTAGDVTYTTEPLTSVPTDNVTVQVRDASHLETFATITLPDGEEKDMKPVQLDIVIKDDEDHGSGLVYMKDAQSGHLAKPMEVDSVVNVVKAEDIPQHLMESSMKSDGTVVSGHHQLSPGGSTSWVVVSSGHVKLPGTTDLVTTQVDTQGDVPTGGATYQPRPTLLGWTVPIPGDVKLTPGGDQPKPISGHTQLALSQDGTTPVSVVNSTVAPSDVGTVPYLSIPQGSLVHDVLGPATTQAPLIVSQPTAHQDQPLLVIASHGQANVTDPSPPHYTTLETAVPTHTGKVAVGSSVTPSKKQEKASRKRTHADSQAKAPYSCKSCGAEFFSSSSLGGHRVWCMKKQEKKPETTPPQWKCETCSRTFKKQCNFLSHKKHCMKQFRCLLCLAFFPKKEHLIQHACSTLSNGNPSVMDEDVDSKNLHVCDQCGLCMYNHLHVTQHKNQHKPINDNKGPKQYSCKLCEVYFVKSSSAQQHKDQCHVTTDTTATTTTPAPPPPATTNTTINTTTVATTTATVSNTRTEILRQKPAPVDSGDKTPVPVAGWLGTQKKNIRDMLNMVKEAQEQASAVKPSTETVNGHLKDSSVNCVIDAETAVHAIPQAASVTAPPVAERKRTSKKRTVPSSSSGSEAVVPMVSAPAPSQKMANVVQQDQCPTCKISTPPQILNDTETHVEPRDKQLKQVRCQKCMKIFSRQRDWAVHMTKCTKDVDVRKADEFTKYSCGPCNMRFGLTGLLVHHLHMIHSLSWETANSVAAHTNGQVTQVPPPDKVIIDEQKESAKKRYKCKVCKKRLHSWKRYDEHKKEHAASQSSSATSKISMDENSQASQSTQISDRTSETEDSATHMLESEDTDSRTGTADTDITDIP